MAVVDERAGCERETWGIRGEYAVSKRVLLVAYPLLPVSESSAGGAEQILWTLERELAERGWETEVAACAGSQVTGKLLATGEAPLVEDSFVEREREHTERIVEECVRTRYSMVLDHSGHLFRHAARVNAYILATLHLPRSLYEADAFTGLTENVFFNCVSESQKKEFMDVPQVLGVVRNGIAVERFKTGGRKANYLLWLGRICPEKAPHLAVAAAAKAGIPIVLAGHVYPFAWHTKYWENQVKPLIDGKQVRFVELPSFAQKTKLLREARALLVTSQINETTSLVALEAMASGTPVIGFAAGALGEVVPEGTGFLVANVEEMAEACGSLSTIRTQDCRQWVEREYSAAAMADAYEHMITNLVEQKRWQWRRR
jgi:glycosyltransferase involved in cell wall biosynthesis